MSIEHRWTPRQPARLPVSIACRPLGLLRGRLHDISNGGAMVKISDRLPSNAPVELILPVRINGGDRSYRVPAIVTRSSESGVGLMFGRIEPEVWTALSTQLQPKASTDVEVEDEPILDVPAASRS